MLQVLPREGSPSDCLPLLAVALASQRVPQLAQLPPAFAGILLGMVAPATPETVEALSHLVGMALQWLKTPPQTPRWKLAHDLVTTFALDPVLVLQNPPQGSSRGGAGAATVRAWAAQAAKVLEGGEVVTATIPVSKPFDAARYLAEAGYAEAGSVLVEAACGLMRRRHLTSDHDEPSRPHPRLCMAGDSRRIRRSLWLRSSPCLVSHSSPSSSELPLRS